MLMLQGYKWDTNQISFFFNKFNVTRNGRMTMTEWLKLSIFVLMSRRIFDAADTGAFSSVPCSIDCNLAPL